MIIQWTVTRQVVSPESLETGEPDDHGFVDNDGNTFYSMPDGECDELADDAYIRNADYETLIGELERFGIIYSRLEVTKALKAASRSGAMANTSFYSEGTIEDYCTYESIQYGLHIRSVKPGVLQTA